MDLVFLVFKYLLLGSGPLDIHGHFASSTFEFIRPAEQRTDHVRRKATSRRRITSTRGGGQLGRFRAITPHPHLHLPGWMRLGLAGWLRVGLAGWVPLCQASRHAEKKTDMRTDTQVNGKVGR